MRAKIEIPVAKLHEAPRDVVSHLCYGNMPVGAEGSIEVSEVPERYVWAVVLEGEPESIRTAVTLYTAISRGDWAVAQGIIATCG